MHLNEFEKRHKSNVGTKNSNETPSVPYPSKYFQKGDKNYFRKDTRNFEDNVFEV